MKHARLRTAVTVCVAGLMGASLTLGGCASRSRVDELRAEAGGVERLLETERAKALREAPPVRDARYQQLSGLRWQLSLANIAIGTVPLLELSETEKTAAYDVLDEYLGTIRWNAGLPPDATAKAMPESPIMGKLRLTN